MSDPAERDRALLAALPTAYAVAVRLRRAGGTPAEIAAALGIELDAVEGVCAVADRKLDELRASVATAGDPPAPSSG